MGLASLDPASWWEVGAFLVLPAPGVGHEAVRCCRSGVRRASRL